MKQKTVILLVSVFTLAFSVACVTLMGGESPEAITPPEELNFEEPATPTPVPPPTVQPLAACPLITDEIVRQALLEGDSSGGEGLENDVYLITYEVDENDELANPQYETFSDQFKALREDVDAHYQVWNYFRALIPPDQRSMLTEYVISTDGKSGLLAAVGQTETDPNTWSLQVDIMDTVNDYELTYTLVHEFGHLLTLNPGQVPPSLAMFNNPDDENIYFKEASACPNYFPGEGCAKADSYIDDFYNTFWADIYDEWTEINLEEDEDIYYEKMDAFYTKYEDQFVTSYAATNPEEDIAETWSFFVFSPEPSGDIIAEQKILFFYRYPELVALRESIRSNLCAVFPNQ